MRMFRQDITWPFVISYIVDLQGDESGSSSIVKYIGARDFVEEGPYPVPKAFYPGFVPFPCLECGLCGAVEFQGIYPGAHLFVAFVVDSAGPAPVGRVYLKLISPDPAVVHVLLAYASELDSGVHSGSYLEIEFQDEVAVVLPGHEEGIRSIADRGPFDGTIDHRKLRFASQLFPTLEVASVEEVGPFLGTGQLEGSGNKQDGEHELFHIQ